MVYIIFRISDIDVKLGLYLQAATQSRICSVLVLCTQLHKPLYLVRSLFLSLLFIRSRIHRCNASSMCVCNYSMLTREVRTIEVKREKRRSPEQALCDTMLSLDSACFNFYPYDVNTCSYFCKKYNIIGSHELSRHNIII